ncbi:MAG: hypothetical protein NC120_00635 [Ruminococcus sp.]|nr:hypothetical protein [Ruminococcus sp.]
MQKLIRSNRDGTFIISEIDRTFRNRIRRYAYIDIVILLLFLPMIFMTYFSAGSFAGIFTGICYAGIFIAVNVGVVLLLANRLIKKRNEFVNGFLQTDGEYYMKLCSQAERVGLVFRTFYITDDYLFVPDDMLMIPFGALREAYAQRIYARRSKALVGINMIFTFGNGTRKSVKVRNIRDFEENGDSFLRNINSKITRSGR